MIMHAEGFIDKAKSILEIYKKGMKLDDVMSQMKEKGLFTTKGYILQTLEDEGLIDRKKIVNKNITKSLPELAELMGGLSSEGVRQYLMKNGLFKKWCRKRGDHKEESRLERQLKREEKILLRYRLVNSINRHLVNEARKENTAESYVVLHNNNLKWNSYSNDQLLKFFDIVVDAIETGKKPSLQYLAEKAGLRSHMQSKVILERVGLKPFNESYGVTRLTEEDIEHVKNAYEVINFSGPDIQHFLGKGKSCVKYHLLKIREEKGHKKRPYKAIKQTYQGWLHARDASTVMEALDSGFTMEESLELVDLMPDPRDYLFENIAEIEQIIVEGLQKMYPDKNITKPYKTW
jgi:hypothetical protein